MQVLIDYLVNTKLYILLKRELQQLSLIFAYTDTAAGRGDEGVKRLQPSH
jgi:hypothetical protein